jgi:Na+/melibiose symporter-like transporter
MSEPRPPNLSDSVGTRWFSLIIVSLPMFAAYMFVDLVAPLEELAEKTYHWTPDQYGFFSGFEYWLNIFGFLLLSGIILDKMGIRFTGLTATVVMTAGALLQIYGLSPYFANGGFGYSFFSSFWSAMPATAKVAALGFGIFGVGVEMGAVTTSRAIVKWFSGKEMALAMGMQLATARLGSSLAFFFSADIAGIKTVAGETVGEPLRPLYVGVGALVLGILTFLIYTFYDARLDRQIGKSRSGGDPTEEFHLKDLGKIIRNPGFLTISLLCVLFYSGVFPFLKYAVNMMQSKLGVSARVGGRISGLLPVGTILLTPLIGHYLDRKGKGATLMIFGSALLCLAHLAFAVAPLNLSLAIAAIIVLGVAFSLIPAAMWPCVPKIVEERYLGSAFALVFWIQNIGLGVVPWLIGLIKMKANPGVAERIAQKDPTAVYNYTIPMLVFASLGFCAILLAFVLLRIDKKKGYGLEKPNKKPAA